MPHDWSEEEAVKRGGFSVTGSGELMIHNYEEIMDLLSGEIECEGCVFGADWYMTSLNQAEVAERPEYDRRLALNALGYVFFDDKPASLVAINGGGMTSVFRRDVLGTGDAIASFEPMPTLAELAASVNLLSRELGGVCWQIAGVEYRGGGTFPAHEDSLVRKLNTPIGVLVIVLPESE